jgi:hypothetical protein
MKLLSLPKFVSAAAFLAVLPLGISRAHAISAPASPDSNGAVWQQAPVERMAWTEEKRHKLRHAFWLLEQADRDYHGHKDAALKEIKKAGDLMGLDLHGEGYGGARQKWSDERLREARQALDDIVDKSAGREHKHIRAAIHEIDRALEVR